MLFLDSLEGTVAEFRRGVDELESDLLQVPTRGVNHQRLADRDDTLLGSRNGALHQEEVVLDDTVVGEATERSDDLLGDVRFGGGVAVVATETNAVDLLIDLRSVVVAV